VPTATAVVDGSTLIGLKDTIHTKWFELQNTKQSDREYAYLQKKAYDEIVKLGKKAISTLKKVNPNSPFIERIQKTVDEVERKSMVSPEMSVGPGRTARSTGGETSQSWKYRDKDRKEGKDVPFGGCLCDIGDDVMAIIENLVVSPES